MFNRRKKESPRMKTLADLRAEAEEGLLNKEKVEGIIPNRSSFRQGVGTDITSEDDMTNIAMNELIDKMAAVAGMDTPEECREIAKAGGEVLGKEAAKKIMEAMGVPRDMQGEDPKVAVFGKTKESVEKEIFKPLPSNISHDGLTKEQRDANES